VGSENAPQSQPVRRRPTRAARRRRILAAARRAFSRHGYKNARLDEVARVAGVGKATLYREFNSKDRLLLAVATAGIEELRDRMVEAVSQPGPPEVVFGSALRSALGFFDDNRELARILFLEAGELRAELVRRYFQLYEGSKAAADAAFALHPARAPLSARSAGELADVLMYLVAGRVAVWLVLGQPDRLADGADLLLHTYVGGVFGSEQLEIGKNG
jgi:AcrR family transcriptional regulator